MHGQLVAQALGTTVDRIVIRQSDTDVTGYDTGAFGSTGVVVAGLALHRAALQLRAKVLAAAAALRDHPSDEPRTWDAQDLTPESASGVPLTEIARAAPGLTGQGTHDGSPRSVAFNVHGFRVAVDPATGEVTVLRSVQAVDAGTVLHPEQLRGQVEGGTGQAIGTALYEEMRLDDEGRVTTASFRSYHVPQMVDLPRTEVLFAQTSDDLGPLGAKSMSEAPYNPVAPALANADPRRGRHPPPRAPHVRRPPLAPPPRPDPRRTPRVRARARCSDHVLGRPHEGPDAGSARCDRSRTSALVDVLTRRSADVAAWRPGRGGGSGPARSVSGRPVAPVRDASTSASTDTAVSPGVDAPMSSPIGACRRASSSSVTPRSTSSATPAVLRPARPHRAHVPGPGAQRGEHQVGVEPVVVRHHADHVARTEPLLREVPDGPVDDDLVGPRVAARGGEHGAGVAHRHAVARRPGPRRQRGGELERPVDDHPRRGRRHLDEHLDAAVGTHDPHEAGAVEHGHPVGQRTVERGHQDGVVAARRRGQHGHVGRTELARVHPQHAAAGQADGERVLVGHAVLLHAGRGALEHRGAQLVQGTLDAPAGDAPEGRARVVDRHRRARRPSARCRSSTRPWRPRPGGRRSAWPAGGPRSRARRSPPAGRCAGATSLDRARGRRREYRRPPVPREETRMSHRPGTLRP